MSRSQFNGQAAKRTNFKILQRRAAVLTQLPAPGRYDISAHVTFQLGSGTPPVTVSRTVTVCAPPLSTRRPSFTG